MGDAPDDGLFYDSISLDSVGTALTADESRDAEADFFATAARWVSPPPSPPARSAPTRAAPLSISDWQTAAMAIALKETRAALASGRIVYVGAAANQPPTPLCYGEPYNPELCIEWRCATANRAIVSCGPWSVARPVAARSGCGRQFRVRASDALVWLEYHQRALRSPSHHSPVQYVYSPEPLQSPGAPARARAPRRKKPRCGSSTCINPRHCG